MGGQGGHALKTRECTITVKNRLGELQRIAASLDSLPPLACCPSRKRSEINLAVEELFTNIVSHGIEDDREHDITLNFAWTDNELFIRIEDDGKPFNPITMAVPDTTCCLAERCVGGLGIHLVRHFMDAVDYVRRKGRNILTLKKTLSETALKRPDPEPDGTGGKSRGSDGPKE
jgi:anti-sigma regulatory factor (Ser/Thr protein kinase)